jgi:multicomponent Na+:H+ antiporter subunit F
VIFELSAAGLLIAVVPAGVVAFRGDAVDRTAGLCMVSAVLTLLLLVLAQIAKQVPFQDAAVALALMSYGGGLVFARFLERWL